MAELELLIDFFQNADRQGPGSVEETLLALQMIKIQNGSSIKIADIGCGTGSQSIALAKSLKCEIIGVDLFPEFLDNLNARKQEQEKLLGEIKTLQASMEDLPFEENEFDIIWSEGAIYNMGFEAGIKAWKKFIKEGGYLAVSEITWLTHSRPKELEDFWMKEYPEIDLASNKIKILESNGYILCGYFFLSPKSWEENYYLPLEKQIPAFLEKHNHIELAQKIVNENQKEIALYRKFKDYYSYGFYVAKKC